MSITSSVANVAQSKEIWKPVPNTNERYMVSNLGNVKSMKYLGWDKEKNLTPTDNGMGYLRVKIFRGKTYKTTMVHRLVAEAFVKNTSGNNTVNHIDGVKSNNAAHNLEWCTQKDNVRHAWRLGLCKNTVARSLHGKNTIGNLHQINRKLVLDTSTGIYYESATEAANTLGYNRRNLTSHLNGEYKNKTSLIYV